MKLSENAKKEITNELKFIIERMSKEQDPLDRLFYFSGLFGVLNRLMNSEYSDDLVFAHAITRHTHQEMSSRLKQIKQGDTVVALYEAHFSSIISCLNEIVNCIKKDRDIIDVLKKLTVIGYSTTGNGFYLFKRGILKL